MYLIIHWHVGNDKKADFLVTLHTNIVLLWNTKQGDIVHTEIQVYQTIAPKNICLNLLFLPGHIHLRCTYHVVVLCLHHQWSPVPVRDRCSQKRVRQPWARPKSPCDLRKPAPCPKTHLSCCATVRLSWGNHSSISVSLSSRADYDRAQLRRRKRKENLKDVTAQNDWSAL